jgi:hypothetical protein
MALTSGLDQIAGFLRACGLRTAWTGTALSVTSPVSSVLSDVVSVRSGRYLTGSGYEIGAVGDERRSADRVAFLLGVQTPAVGDAA